MDHMPKDKPLSKEGNALNRFTLQHRLELGFQLLTPVDLAKRSPGERIQPC